MVCPLSLLGFPLFFCFINCVFIQYGLLCQFTVHLLYITCMYIVRKMENSYSHVCAKDFVSSSLSATFLASLCIISSSLSPFLLTCLTRNCPPAHGITHSHFVTLVACLLNIGIDLYVIFTISLCSFHHVLSLTHCSSLFLVLAKTVLHLLLFAHTQWHSASSTCHKYKYKHK